MISSKTAPQYSARSGWNALLPPRMPRNQAPAERRFYAIVVGAGYTGLAAARRLAELMPEREILVIEASEIGEGSSARNSGFLSVNPTTPRPNAYGSADDDAIRKMRIVAAGLEWMRTLVKDHKIECDWDEKAPRISAAATSKGERKARSARGALEKWGMQCSEYSAQELRGLLGTDYYNYGYKPETYALVQPAALVRGLADTLPSNVMVLEHSTVEAVVGGGPFQVRTHQGSFAADKVFIANNGHAEALGFLTNRMIVAYTYAALTPELDNDELDRFGTLPAWGVAPPMLMGTTMRKTLKRVLIRSSFSYEKESDLEKVRSTLRRLLQRRFPRMRCYEFEHVWGGEVAIGSNGEGYFGELRPGLYASVGCQGAGVVRGTIYGKLLAEMAAGSQSSLLTDRLKAASPKWIPPEPFRGIGAISRMTWEHWSAGGEC